jgi:hypothetical protein
MKWNRKHQDVLLWFLEHPGGKQKDCAKAVGYSEAWLSKIVNTPEFKRRHTDIMHRALTVAARKLLIDDC